MNKFKLTTQINIIFSFVTILGCVVFLFVLNLSFNKGFENQNRLQLGNYLDHIKFEYNYNDQFFTREYGNLYNDFIIINNQGSVHFSSNILSTSKRLEIIEHFRTTYYNPYNALSEQRISYRRLGDLAIEGVIVNSDMEQKYAIIVVSNVSKYINDFGGDVPFYTSLAFLNILVLGNIIIWLWSSSTVKKLKDLKESVDKMVDDDYQKPIDLTGAEEITQLAESIEHMRKEILENEQTKKNMIQNIGHDFKTPIAVIKSYAEAIEDGMVDKTEGTDLIIKQTDILNRRVKQLVELNKIGYLKPDEEMVEVSMAEVIRQIIDHYKFLTPAKIEFDVVSDWKHKMIAENFYIAISNIIDNATRYAQTIIRITLSNKKLTIYNDGEQIDENLIPKIFKPYEKGSKGQYGLGLAIVYETLKHFNLQVKVCNKDKGVQFKIEPNNL